jgi:phosphonate transport system substrate-binding protein
VTPLRVYSFLGEAARAHYDEVGQLVARAAGFEATPLEEPGLARLDETIAAPGPALLFLCGLPYVRLRDDNAPIEAIAGAVPIGEPAAQYFADLVVREDLEAASAADLAGRRFGFNGRDSLSGYVLPYAALEPRGLAEPLYDHAIETGSHRRSLRLLAAGEIDVAPIDSTVLALEARSDPAIAALRVLERLGPAPIPPVVLLHGDPHLAEHLTQALVSLDQHVIGRRALALGLIERYVETSDGAYDAVRELDGAVR